MAWDVQKAITVVTVAASIVGLIVGYFDLRNRLDRLWFRDDAGRYLTDLPSSGSEIPDPARDRRLDAEAIKNGTGPQEWTGGGETVRKGQAFYVGESNWNNEVVNREGGSCVIHRGGMLTVLGFSERRRAALVRYEPPEGDRTGGTACDSGTEMFYPLR